MERHQSISGTARTCSILRSRIESLSGVASGDDSRVVETFTPTRPLAPIRIAGRHAWLVGIEVCLASTLALPSGQSILDPVVRWPHLPEFFWRKAVEVLPQDLRSPSLDGDGKGGVRVLWVHPRGLGSCVQYDNVPILGYFLCQVHIPVYVIKIILQQFLAHSPPHRASYWPVASIHEGRLPEAFGGADLRSAQRAMLRALRLSPAAVVRLPSPSVEHSQGRGPEKNDHRGSRRIRLQTPRAGRWRNGGLAECKFERCLIERCRSACVSREAQARGSSHDPGVPRCLHFRGGSRWQSSGAKCAARTGRLGSTCMVRARCAATGSVLRPLVGGGRL